MGKSNKKQKTRTLRFLLARKFRPKKQRPKTINKIRKKNMKKKLWGKKNCQNRKYCPSIPTVPHTPRQRNTPLDCAHTVALVPRHEHAFPIRSTISRFLVFSRTYPTGTVLLWYPDERHFGCLFQLLRTTHENGYPLRAFLFRGMQDMRLFATLRHQTVSESSFECYASPPNRSRV